MRVYQRGEKEFTLIIEDISGNSYVENLHAPGNDPNTKTELFSRTADQNEKLGFFETTSEDQEVEQKSESKTEGMNENACEKFKHELKIMHIFY